MERPNCLLASEKDQAAFPFILQIIHFGEVLEKAEKYETCRKQRFPYLHSEGIGCNKEQRLTQRMIPKVRNFYPFLPKI